MPLVRVPSLLDLAMDHRCAVGAFVCSSLAMVTKAVGVARAEKSPVVARIRPEVRAVPVTP